MQNSSRRGCHVIPESPRRASKDSRALTSWKTMRANRVGGREGFRPRGRLGRSGYRNFLRVIVIRRDFLAKAEVFEDLGYIICVARWCSRRESWNLRTWTKFVEGNKFSTAVVGVRSPVLFRKDALSRASRVFQLVLQVARTRRNAEGRECLKFVRRGA